MAGEMKTELTDLDDMESPPHPCKVSNLGYKVIFIPDAMHSFDLVKNDC
jgi:hypothetical protein